MSVVKSQHAPVDVEIGKRPIPSDQMKLLRDPTLPKPPPCGSAPGAMYIKEEDIATTTLRFAVGIPVECNCGGWEPGTIVKQFYRCAAPALSCLQLLEPVC